MKRGATECLDGDYGPQWETLRRRRGPDVRCDACCGAPIERGDLYVEVAGIWDGRWDRLRLHKGCHDELLRLCDQESGMVEFERVAEYARENGLRFDSAAKVWREAVS